MKFVDLFAGIGGFRMGMQRVGHEPVGWCEKDKFAQKSYRVIYNTEGEWFSDDIRTVEPSELPEFEVLCGGFPCQSFSIAGNRGGFEDTKGTLFFEIARLAKERQPKYLFLENVKGLLSHDGGRTFGTILNTLHDLGYSVEWQVLNSKNFRVPQNRERVFIIGHLGGFRGGQVFPIRGENKNSIRQLGNIVDDSEINFKNPQRGRIYSQEGVSPCLNCMEGGGLEPKILAERGRYNEDGKIEQKAELRKDNNINTLTSVQKDNYVIEQEGCYLSYGKLGTRDYANTIDANYHKGLDNRGGRTAVLENRKRIRKLTPKECWRLQGFPDWAFGRAAEVNSDTQLYKQAGNSVTVNVVYEIAKRLKEVEK